MADNFLLFCEVIKKPTVTERLWLIKEHRRRYGPDEAGEYPDRDETMGDFNLCIEDSDAYIFSEDSGSVDHAADFVQAFLQKFRPKDCFHIEWATTCSKSRAGEFGGGAVFITAKKMKWFIAGDLVLKEEERFLKARKG